MILHVKKWFGAEGNSLADIYRRGRRERKEEKIFFQIFCLSPSSLFALRTSFLALPVLAWDQV